MKNYVVVALLAFVVSGFAEQYPRIKSVEEVWAPGSKAHYFVSKDMFTLQSSDGKYVVKAVSLDILESGRVEVNFEIPDSAVGATLSLHAAAASKPMRVVPE